MLAGETISLAGHWWCRIDGEDKGIEKHWYAEDFSTIDNCMAIELPGTLGGNQMGEQTIYEPGMTMESVRNFRERYVYRGRCWYQKSIEIPIEWEGETIGLFLERILMTSQVWVNGRYIGRRDTLVEPHDYIIQADGVMLDTSNTSEASDEMSTPDTPRTLQLTIAIDNRDAYHLGEYGHAYTTETQGIWNGIVGKLHVQKLSTVRLKELIVETNADFQHFTLKGRLEGCDTLALKTYKVSICEGQERKMSQYEGVLEGHCVENSLHIELPIPNDCVWWTAFTPQLYEMTLQIYDAEDRVATSYQELVGFRRFEVDGRQIMLNRQPIHLRGNLDCCVHPHTGYPPCDKEYWEYEMTQLKNMGMNHIRFHSYCPPEAAFDVADRMGMYLQIEGPVWLDEWFIAFGSYPEHEAFIPKEALRIVRNYGNHPSFCIFCNGNELRGDFSLMHRIIGMVKGIRSDILYTLTANYDRPADPLDDVFISVEADGHGMRGNRFYESMATRLDTAYNEAVQGRNMPLIAHESGQFAVYPDVREIPKYTGTMMPYNLMVIRDDLTCYHLEDCHEDYVTGSLVATMRLYKEEIESYLRTEDYAGFQLLGVQDFPGQCCATVGLLNSLWEAKPGFDPKSFRRFNQDIVPIALLSKRIFQSIDEMDGEIMVYHYGERDLIHEWLRWTIWDGNRCIYESRQLVHLEKGHRHHVAALVGRDISQLLPEGYELTEPKELELCIEIEGTEYNNSWPLWVFPSCIIENVETELEAESKIETDMDTELKLESQVEADIESELEADEEAVADVHVVVRKVWNEEVIQLLEEGNHVLLSLDKNQLEEGVGYNDDFYPVFWSPAFFKSYKSCGFIREEHPIFKYFPSDRYLNFQWYHLLKDSVNLQLDPLDPSIKPIIRVIPNFYANRCMSNLFEGRIGNGVLLVTTLNLSNKSRPEVKWMEYGLKQYLAHVTKDEVPVTSLDTLNRIFAPHDLEEKDGASILSENFIQ